jgi:hypothetical protein
MSDRIEWITIITALTGLLVGLILIYLALGNAASASSLGDRIAVADWRGGQCVEP